MSYDDFEVLDALPNHGHGGARAGAGKKPAGYQKAPEVVEFDKARARNEAAKAQLNELELKVKSREYVSRAAVREVSATAVQSISQTLRSIPDNLERKGLPPDQAALVGRVIDEALNELATEFEMIAGGDEVNDD